MRTTQTKSYSAKGVAAQARKLTQKLGILVPRLPAVLRMTQTIVFAESTGESAGTETLEVLERSPHVRKRVRRRENQGHREKALLPRREPGPRR
jgi:hypothetical protein